MEFDVEPCSYAEGRPLIGARMLLHCLRRLKPADKASLVLGVLALQRYP